MIDTHCKLDHEPWFENLTDIINRSKETGVKKLLTICTTHKSFEKIIKPHIIEIESAIDSLLATAKIKAEDIDIVLRTGGSSLIPAVKNKLTERFGNKVIEHDPFTSVASGLAIAEYNGFNVPAFNNNPNSQASSWT